MGNLHKTFFIPLALLCLVLLGTVGYFYQSSRSSSISGSVGINGVIPDNSTVSISVKKQGDKDFKEVIEQVEAQDGTSWFYNDAEKGSAYEVKAILESENKPYGESTTLVVTAPATGEILEINSTYKPAPTQATISGGIDLNGSVVPGQSIISLYQKKVGETEFSLVSSSIEADDGATWSWDAALAGEQYELKAILYVYGTYMGESTVIKITAPAANEILRINSHYVSSPTNATVSGSFNINGPIPSNTTATIYKQGPGDKDWVTVQDNIAVSNGIQWSWSSANQGVSYKMQASIYSNGNDIGDSQVITLTAPASNEVFTINYNISGSPTAQPPNSPTNQCVSQSGNNWNVNINFLQVSNAKTYWLQVGSQSGGSDITNSYIGSNGQPSQTYTLNNINNSTTYYARYAASTCTNCTGSNQYSIFSNILQFSCAPHGPTATPSPYPPQPTYTPYPTPTLYPTNTPTPTFTPTPTLPLNTSGCNQTCVSNGYTCAIGLQCVSGSMPGSQVCRNPNCTTEADCTC